MPCREYNCYRLSGRGRTPPLRRVWERVQEGGQGRPPLQRAGEFMQAWPGSSGRPTPTNRLPIDFRWGRCPHRPGGTSPQNIRRAACPHAAARHTRRVPLSDQPAQAQNASRMETQRRYESKARNLHCAAVAWLKGTDAGGTSAAERIPKPWFWRRSFLPFFRRRKKGSRRRQRRYRRAYRAGITDRRTSDRIFAWGAEQDRRRGGAARFL